jgi:hypothetical protein
MARTRDDTYLPALFKAYEDMQRLDPFKVAFLAACSFDSEERGGHFALYYFGEEYRIEFPRIAVKDARGQEPDITTRLVLLHYLIHADGTPPADHWIAFRELPDGRVYDLAFQRRANQRVAGAFAADAAGFLRAAQALGGEKLAYGDASCMFRVLPRLSMAVVLHLGDEEFGPAANVLFDGAAGHYLPTEDLAVLGGILAARLIKTGAGRS